MFVIIPAMVGLVVLRTPIIHLLFERGSFTPETTIQTSVALFYYALGLWAIAGVRITVLVFYALQDAKTPVKAGVITFLANILFSLLLMGPLQHGGLALAITLSSTVNFFLLIVFLRRKTGPLGMKAALNSLGKILFSSFVMGLFSYFICFRIDWFTPGSLFVKILHLGGAIGGGILVYVTLSSLFRCPELENMKDMFRRKRHPRTE